MIKSLLIANRGEIAFRIIKTARKMGLRTIAVYSETDRNALHVRMADEAHLLGGAAATDSYLRSARILSIAKEAGADAVHPGYGFLSENADFAQLAADAGIVFVGPPPAAIRAMGLKDQAKKLMSDAGVPVVPGYHGENQDPAFLKRKAYEIGYPVLIKAVAGGGGKGMRKVMKALEFDDALEAAKREAQSSFGNDIVLIERFVQNPRHIEIQVFADGHGNVVHLFERDCSLQRRHQKVIEEAPAPDMPENVRAAMGKAACDAARAVGYQGAGTVEFIADGSAGLSEDGFFFMEMNTRLQVEHPVTEMITGQDLVEWQLRVAGGEALPEAQDELAISGHAVEARIYAEDPAEGFLPSTGLLVALELNAGPENDGVTVRIDTGVEQGDTISRFYDPMIAKLIVHAQDRASALEALATRLDHAVIAGPVTNTGFLSKLCRNEHFQSGHFDTGLIDQNLDSLIENDPVDGSIIAAGLSSLIAMERNRLDMENPAKSGSPWSADDGFQLSGVRETGFEFQLDGEYRLVQVRYDQEGIAVLGEDGKKWFAPSANANSFVSEQTVHVVRAGRQWIFAPHVQTLQDGDSAASGGAVAAPMHGKVITVTVKPGDVVEEGDVLFSIEAMKMEHSVIAPRDAVVQDVLVQSGDQMKKGAIAIQLQEAEAEAAA
ncbi:MAG: biotin carboxylase N-terminal domain-containing protein [Pseudomonadota bacterium]